MPDAVTPAARPATPVAESPAQRRHVGRYELLFELARGGMGTVWVGRLHGVHGFGRFVAIKALKRFDDDGDAHAQFLEEAKVTARIHHPSVVSTLELFEHHGEPFIAMDLVRGVSLARILDRCADAGERLPLEIAASVAMQVAAGLHAAHELADRKGVPLGLVHRDVSPQNVLVSYDGRVYVADFGIAKFRRETVATESGIVKGKFAYMSPEQARAQSLDRRSDVFSLGIVLHEMITGKRLYSEASAADALIRIVSETAPDVRASRPDVPADLAAIVARCLEKPRDARFSSTEALRDALRVFISAHGRAVDEHRVAELLGRFFARDREALERKLSAIDDANEVDPALGKTLPIVDDRPTEISHPPLVTMTREKPVATEQVASEPVVVPTSKAPLMIAIAFIALLAAGAVAFAAHQMIGRRDVSGPSASPSASPMASTVAPAAGSVAIPTPPPSGTTAAPVASASGPSSASATPTVVARPKPASRPHATATTTATTTAPPSPEPTDSGPKKGVPFKNL